MRSRKSVLGLRNNREVRNYIEQTHNIRAHVCTHRCVYGRVWAAR